MNTIVVSDFNKLSDEQQKAVTAYSGYLIPHSNDYMIKIFNNETPKVIEELENASIGFCVEYEDAEEEFEF